MTGLIDVGGGLRAVYGAGVLDYCLDHGIAFPYCIGISAGSANVVSYLAGQRGRNLKFYSEYALRKEYISFRNWIRKGSYVDLDYAYSVLTNSDGEFPLDYQALAANPAELKVVATNARTGKAVYFDKRDLHQDHYDILKASSDIPVIDRPYFYRGTPYYDGGIADPIPAYKAFSDGCSKVVVILTRPFSYLRTPGRDGRLSHILRRKYPRAADALARRYEVYNDALIGLRVAMLQGRALVIAPDDISGMDTLTRNPESIRRLYGKGYADAQRIPAFCRPSCLSANTSS